MKTKALASLAIVAVAAIASAQIPTTTTMSWSPNKSRYARGETFTVTIRTTLWYGAPIPAGSPILVLDGWGRDGEQQSIYRWIYADGNGSARTSYRVPTSPFADNVQLAGICFARWYYGFSQVARRVPIG